MARSKHTDIKLYRILIRLTRKYSAGWIQEQLGNVYEQYAIASKTEVEEEMWMKCSKASKNLSSGMTKWIHNMIDELETGEHDDAEGG